VASVGTFVQVDGRGGFGCRSRATTALPGGQPGPLVFVDPAPNNNFWGSALDRASNIRITGELRNPRGGEGGGAGGDFSVSCALGDPNFFSDEKGGGGGGGGGVLIVKALGKIEVRPTGRIAANGGHGGGGAWAGSNNRGGGGGGGAGGMVVLMAGDSIVLHTHGGTYTSPNFDANFAITADGGVGLLDPYGGNANAIVGKYNHPSYGASTWNGAPSGGFGGLGVIQLMAPPGDPNSTTDGTRTILDDNIVILNNGIPLSGQGKMNYISWRGTPDKDGVFKDDFNQNVTTARAEAGDLRPRPILMPAPFGSRSRIRSKWIDMGAVNRTMSDVAGDGPRGLMTPAGFTPGSTYGPIPEFEALTSDGFVKTVDNLDGVLIDYPEILAALGVASIERGTSYRGTTTNRVRLGQPNAILGASADRYSNYTAIVRRGADRVGEYRIVGHDDGSLYLAPGADLPDGVPLTVAVVAKFFSIFTGTVEGFSQSFIGRDGFGDPNLNVPRSNVQIAFAFHQNPGNSAALRFPAVVPGQALGFFADWTNAAKLEQLRSGGYRFVMYDLIFDTDFEVDPRFPNDAKLGPDTPRPEVRRLVLPYRY
jgi:hypothetical protein